MTRITILPLGNKGAILIPKRNRNPEILAITESMMYYLGRKDTVLIS